MKVIITQNTEDNLETIFHYHAEHSLTFADRFYDGIVSFIIENISQFPRLGREYNTNSGLRKLVYDGNYNIYYLVKNDAAFIVYILDGRRMLNETLGDIEPSKIEGQSP